MALLVVLFIYAMAMAIKSDAALGPIDDHEFLNNLMKGHFQPAMSSPGLGRYTPLAVSDIGLIAVVFGPSVKFFYLWNALKYVLILLLSYGIMVVQLDLDRVLGLLVVFCLAANPSFLGGFSRLHISETSVTLLFLIFLAASLDYFKTHRVGSLLVAVVSVFPSLFFKEPVFIAASAAAFGLAILNARKSFKISLTYLVPIGLAIGTFLVMFLVGVDFFRSKTTYLSSFHRSSSQFWKDLAFSELPLLLAAAGFLLARLFLGFRRLLSVDAVFAAGFFYVLFFSKINIYSYYYLIPAYALILIAFGGACALINKKAGIVLALGVFALSLRQTPKIFFLERFYAYKMIPSAYQETVTFLRAESVKSSQMKIFLVGAPRGALCELYWSLSLYLNHENPAANIIFDSNQPVDNPVIFGQIAATHTIKGPAYEREAPGTYAAGDYLVVSSPLFASFPEADHVFVDKKARLIFQTENRGWIEFFLNNPTPLLRKIYSLMPYVKQAARLREIASYRVYKVL